MTDYVTNGNMLNKAIREHDKILEDYMESRFKAWCEAYKESTYSVSAKRYWKSQRYYEDDKW